MADWREAILGEFVRGVSRLTLVADPDNLMTEEQLSLRLRERGFDLLEFQDPVEFRYAYESRYRSLWDQGLATDLVVILRLERTGLESLPYDLLQAGRKLSFSLGELFPHLSYRVIEQLDRNLLDPLFATQPSASAERHGDLATQDLALRAVFGLVPEIVAHEVDLLRALLRIHYSGLDLPQLLGLRMAQVLQPRFPDWPLESLFLDEGAFYAFLQERWGWYLGSLGPAGRVSEDSPLQPFRFPGPQRLPFEHPDLRVYLDNLFLEGKLQPLAAPGLDLPADSWVRCGIASSTAQEERRRLDRLFARLEEGCPAPDARHSEWTALALVWAELSARVHQEGDEDQRARWQALGLTLNATFASWLEGHYASLVHLPPGNPAMVHHVPRRLARDLEGSRQRRVTLLVLDGLALDQWVTLRQVLLEQDRHLDLAEGAVFAWIPTLTSVSRQALFAGRPPLYFPTTLHSTHAEEKQWRQFWEGQGLDRSEVAYRRGRGDGTPAEFLGSGFHPERTRAAGLVVDKVDRIMHGMQLGAAGMHNQVRQWAQGGFLADLIQELLGHGHEVWLTADHGNLECRGTGRLTEGVLAETRGERARVYPTAELRARAAGLGRGAREWNPTGLPPGCYPLLAEGTGAFAQEGETLVGHGGLSLEEVLVPLVRIRRRQA